MPQSAQLSAGNRYLDNAQIGGASFSGGLPLVGMEELKLQDQNYCSSAYLLLNNNQLYSGPVGVVQYCITTPPTVKYVYVKRGEKYKKEIKWE